MHPRFLQTRRWRTAVVLAALATWTSVGLALFTNGGFEAGDLTSWTKEQFANPGLTGAPPYTGASIQRQTGWGEVDRTAVVGSPGGGPLSVAVAETASAPGGALMVPRFGDYAAVINYLGDSNNANVLKQQATVQPGDVDSLDGKVHVRLAFAPVLEDPNHAPMDQPWFFIKVRNVSRGTTLYESFAYANQPGVPWQVSGGYKFTDWQVADIAPGNAALAVGDVIELEAIAAGCAQGGHAGWVYVDAFGSSIPGPSVVATAPAQVNASSPLTYTVTARNQGTASLSSGVIRFAVPNNTTFASLSDPGATCVQSGGVVTCNIGTLNVGATYSFQVTVNVGAVANGTVIGAGNYGISGTSEPELLGPLVNSTVTADTLIDLGMSVDNGANGVGNGATPTYTITAQNLSSTTVTGATVTATPPGTLINVSWTCVASGSGACGAAGGTGPINDTVTLAANGTVTYTLTGTVAGLSGTLSMAASIAAPGGSTDQDPANNSAADNDVFVPNVAPTATADSYTVAEDATLTVNAASGVLANDTDGDLDPLAAVLVSGAAHGAVVLNADGSFTYAPGGDFNGTDSFTYKATDGSADSGTVTVTLNVTAVNDSPTLVQPSNVSVMWIAGPQTITLTGISAGGGESDTLTVTAASSAPGIGAAGTVTYGGGSTATFTLTPTVGQQGVATITVAVNDGTTTVQRTFTFSVTPPPFYVTRLYPATGPAPGGVNIRIFGGGFTLSAPPSDTARVARAVAPTVLINGVPAPAVVVESDSVVSAVTPALPAGSALDVQLILPGGQGTLVHAYTPYERPTDPAPPTEPTAPNQPPPDPTNPGDPTAPTTDTDGDGIPDVWEEFYGTDPNDPSDANADPDGDGRTNKEEYDSNTHPDSRSVRYFAEGNAQVPFRTWVNLYNPSPIEAAINITFYLDDATVVHHLVKAAGGARTTVDTSTIAGIQGHAFGMRVDADEAVVINRTITWNEQGIGAAAERGVQLSPTWYFAEGATHANLQTFALLTNPADQPATVEIEYLVSAAGTRVSRTHLVPAHARYTVWVNREGPELADQGFGMVVRSSLPIVAERATYITEGSLFEAGETSVGAPTAGQDWYFAEGVSGPLFNTFLLLANPTATVAEVQVRYLPESGAEVVRTHVVAPYGRVTVPVSDEAAWAPQAGFGMHVHVTNGVDIVAERAMWWSTDADAGTWEEGHGSAGTESLHTAYAIGDGVAGGEQGASTYLLLANPGTSDAQVRVTLAFEDGTAPVSATLTVAAGRRLTIDAATHFPTADGRRFSATLEGLNSVPFLAEQSIYWTFGTGAWRSGVSLPATPLQ
ncbi:hypothetical protein TBR22_A51630 [Luteitalea sp. TBR-22]|uniref:cadherin-like domain-containing protein n=1 Tax=Luteitalea sp. TBR-22 TaxID=2802971 RepID=UPI001AFC3F77|nr:Ig-like domain-containing protein [Luteitalea sp. TBR-22]BCS35928.1 hypothetical protein TBR22_A51630 [Luteitalea sp. TBR-22]